MKRAIALLSLALFAAPDRTAIVSVEKALDRRVETLFDEPWLLIGFTHGVYLDGIGAVFTTEISLAIGPSGPIVPRPDKETMERLKKKRFERLPVLKTSMQDGLIRAAEMLPSLPPAEQVVFGVAITRKSTEDNTGMPAQIVMRATKRDLLEKNKSAIQVREF